MNGDGLRQKFLWRYLSLCFISISLLAACTVAYNWREIRSDEQGFLALFPAKTSFEQKSFLYKNHPIPIALEASVVNETVFAVGTIKVENPDIQSDDLLELMQTNAQKSMASHQDTALVSASFQVAGATGQKVEGHGYQFLGASLDGKYRMYWVYWVTRKISPQITKIYQLSAIQLFSKNPSMAELKKSTEVFNTFLEGFKPY